MKDLTKYSNKLPYDETNIKDIYNYSQKLLGKTFLDVLSLNYENEDLEDINDYYNNPSNKGSLGNLLEEYFFYYKPNNSELPDFQKAELELKTTPYEINKNKFIAGERLVISMIPNTNPIEKEFKNSHLEKKLKNVLMIWYLRNRNKKRIEYSIDYIYLYQLYSKLLSKDLTIILDDYNIIVNKITSGNAHNLSESDTKYLGACTKGSSASQILKPQYYNNKVLAKRRAFSLKQSYMTYILNNYIMNNDKEKFDSIFKDEEIIDGNFESKILDKLNFFIGKTEAELYHAFDLNKIIKSKNINRILVNKILGVNSDKSEEFQKANIDIKTIRVRKNGTPNESVSFPKIVIKDFVNKIFENSNEYNYFEKTRFLFVVFKENEEGNYKLAGSKFWNMPINELETIGKKEWELNKKKFLKGVNFKIEYNNLGKLIVKNDLPKKSETKIFHLRPHSLKSSYIINGIKYGEGSKTDMDELINGDKMTNQCFWLNSEYIKKIVEDIIKKEKC
ncbi:Sau3AI family type II restriction endonuclease [Mycoplasma crocodyli]|uniref:Putative type II restriction endonuclease n=1 Tax=Mycoplasma crocodyli (strain ATCC 51981 / MP145) TaxID=512564 RepID=D5E5B4_MYCCM|nr:Sau3AI family type II restriction endonuclease [Mycoplasma crocodyli]ADE19459.1 putative type II restriction endonuclease [Mycoplasma crocodyli MP145]